MRSNDSQRVAPQLTPARYEPSGEKRRLVTLATDDRRAPVVREIDHHDPTRAASPSRARSDRAARSPAPYSARRRPSGLTSNATAWVTIVDECPVAMSARTTSPHAFRPFFNERYQSAR